MKFKNFILRAGLNKFFCQKKENNLIGFYDTSVSSLNLGDQIINSSGEKQLRTIFNNEQFYKISTHVGSKAIGISLANMCKERIVCGSNLLCDTMFRSANWYLSPLDILRMETVILMGVGWNKYSENTTSITKYFYNLLLNKTDRIHSVRDDYTKSKLNKLGILNVINTGCPTMWGFTKDFCETINYTKSDKVVFTLTDYDRDYHNDHLMIKKLKEQYSSIYFWPQGSKDLEYFNEFNIHDINVLPPSLEAYDDLLENNDIDFIGTRLHAGIRALQHKRKSIIIAIDNRAIEKSKDFNLPILIRSDIYNDLNNKINDNKKCEININEENIIRWKKQFK
ncbi:MAG TPA: polysaccharide pyruvyl transferase family protein [Proteus vulgaris]|nr:polysaccharide pyruvyl transferase family protein [Proteus vulgaris]